MYSNTDPMQQLYEFPQHPSTKRALEAVQASLGMPVHNSCRHTGPVLHMCVITAGPAWQSLVIGWHCVGIEEVIPDCVSADKFKKLFFSSALNMGWYKTAKPSHVGCISLFVSLWLFTFYLSPPPSFLGFSRSGLYSLWHIYLALWCSLWAFPPLCYTAPSLSVDSLTSY